MRRIIKPECFRPCIVWAANRIRQRRSAPTWKQRERMTFGSCFRGSEKAKNDVKTSGSNRPGRRRGAGSLLLWVKRNMAGRIQYRYREYEPGDRVISLRPGTYGQSGTVIGRSQVRPGGCGDIFHPAVVYPEYSVQLDQSGRVIHLSNSNYGLTPENTEKR